MTGQDFAPYVFFGSAGLVERASIFWGKGARLDNPESVNRFIDITLSIRKETVGLGRVSPEHPRVLLIGG